MDTRWKRRNKASFGQMAAFALVLATNPVLAFVICRNFSGAMGILLLLLSCAVCIGCTVFLFVRTGRVQGSDDIFLGESGALPTEVLAAVILFTPLLGMALGLSLGAVDVVIAGIGTAGGGKIADKIGRKKLFLIGRLGHIVVSAGHEAGDLVHFLTSCG